MKFFNSEKYQFEYRRLGGVFKDVGVAVRFPDSYGIITVHPNGGCGYIPLKRFKACPHKFTAYEEMADLAAPRDRQYG